MRNILIYLYDIMTYQDTLRNDIMTLLHTKQINTYKLSKLNTNKLR